jgi:hypothetical protein
MLSPIEVALYFAAIMILLPITIWSLSTGSKAPEKTWASKYYAVERRLGITGNLFLLAVCVEALSKLGLYFGMIDPNRSGSLADLTGEPFATLMAVYLALWARALWKTHRKTRNSADP